MIPSGRAEVLCDGRDFRSYNILEPPVVSQRDLRDYIDFNTLLEIFAVLEDILVPSTDCVLLFFVVPGGVPSCPCILQGGKKKQVKT